MALRQPATRSSPSEPRANGRPGSPSGRPSSLEAAAIAAVALAVATWVWSNIAIKAIPIAGLVASFYRLWFAVPVLWLWVTLAPGLRRRLGATWLFASLGGGCLFSVHQVLFFTSLKATSVSNVSIIGALQPALVLLVAGRMFGERVTSRAIGWSAVALIGTTVEILESHGTPGWSPRGDFLAVLNLFAFTGYFLFSKRIRRDVGASEYVIGMTTVAAVVLLVVCVLSGQDLGSPRGSDWLVLVGLALVSGTLGHLLLNWAHAHTSAFVISIMLLGVPVLASAGAAVFLGETMSVPQMIGGAMVMGSIAIIVSSTPRETAEELSESVAETDAP